MRYNVGLCTIILLAPIVGAVSGFVLGCGVLIGSVVQVLRTWRDRD
jgi:hypothetical protein